jgi:hypothetical protein
VYLAAPGRLPHARFARARREDLITAAEMAAVNTAAGVFTNGTVIRGGVHEGRIPQPGQPYIDAAELLEDHNPSAGNGVASRAPLSWPPRSPWPGQCAVTSSAPLKYFRCDTRRR